MRIDAGTTGGVPKNENRLTNAGDGGCCSNIAANVRLGCLVGKQNQWSNICSLCESKMGRGIEKMRCEKVSIKLVRLVMVKN